MPPRFSSILFLRVVNSRHGLSGFQIAWFECAEIGPVFPLIKLSEEFCMLPGVTGFPFAFTLCAAVAVSKSDKRITATDILYTGLI